MHHVAIMKKKWKLIDKILSGEKTIESRWYKNRYKPWNSIKAGNLVYFKNSGEAVTAVAEVEKVLQFDNLDKNQFNYIIRNYGKSIGLRNAKYSDYYKSKNYCILIFLKDAKELQCPFSIDKTGYGNACAWLCVDDVKNLKR